MRSASHRFLAGAALLVTLANAQTAAHNADRNAPRATQAADTKSLFAARGPGDKDQAKWFEEARLGLFIHWGLYSQSGGEWQGKRYYGITEWLMRRGRIPIKDYATLAADFNPTAFDARAWARAARQSGAKYVVITAKHHDGFAMFGSRVSPYNIVDTTPFRRDPLRELADAVRAEGMKIGFYYSQFQDWADADAEGNDWDFPAKGRDFNRYLERKAIPQLRELLTRYGPVSVIWFDTPQTITKADSQRLYDLVKSMQPDCLVSGRIGNGLGDFTTYGDAEIPAKPGGDRPWEAIFTHNDSWGYSRFDKDFKSSTDLIRLLATVASRGGNTLINIGPDGTGRMPVESVERMAKVGAWLRLNGESVYGTSGTNLSPMAWGVATRRNDRLYLHVLTRPADGNLVLPGVVRDPRSVRLLVGNASLKWRRQGTDLIVALPARPGDAMDSVVVVDGIGALAPQQTAATISRQYPSFTLDPALADLSGAARHAQKTYYHYFGDWKYFDSVADLASERDSVSWALRVIEPGEYRVDLSYAADHASAGQEGTIDLGGNQLRFQVLESGSIAEDRPAPLLTQPIGVVRIARPGTYQLVLRPAQAGRPLFHLKNVEIRPVD